MKNSGAFLAPNLRWAVKLGNSLTNEIGRVKMGTPFRDNAVQFTKVYTVNSLEQTRFPLLHIPVDILVTLKNFHPAQRVGDVYWTL